MVQTRQEYWIPQGHALIKQLLKSCQVCRKCERSPFMMPEIPHLPQEHVARSLPFEFTGLHYFGPLYIKKFEQGSETIVKKVWVCIFTCLVVRAIHFELIEDMSAGEFIMCLLRWFVARQWVPCQIISDNSQQFKVARTAVNKAWSNMLMKSDVNDYSARQGIQ